MLIRQGEKIVFFGDSLTQRTDLNESEHPARRYSLDYAGSYVDILVKRLLIHFPQLEFTFYNRGVGGTPSATCWNATATTLRRFTRP